MENVDYQRIMAYKNVSQLRRKVLLKLNYCVKSGTC